MAAIAPDPKSQQESWDDPDSQRGTSDNYNSREEILNRFYIEHGILEDPNKGKWIESGVYWIIPNGGDVPLTLSWQGEDDIMLKAPGPDDDDNKWYCWKIQQGVTSDGITLAYNIISDYANAVLIESDGDGGALNCSWSVNEIVGPNTLWIIEPINGDKSLCVIYNYGTKRHLRPEGGIFAADSEVLALDPDSGERVTWGIIAPASYPHFSYARPSD